MKLLKTRALSVSLMLPVAACAVLLAGCGGGEAVTTTAADTSSSSGGVSSSSGSSSGSTSSSSGSTSSSSGSTSSGSSSSGSTSSSSGSTSSSSSGSGSSSGTTTGTASITWTIPTENTDGSALTPSNIAGFKVIYGQSATTLDQSLAVNSPTATTATISNLPSGTWFFSVITIDTAGTESSPTNVASKTI